MKPTMKLYLEGFKTNDGRAVLCPLPSSVILFFMRYCQTNQFEVIFVEDYSDGGPLCCTCDIEGLSNQTVNFIPWSQAPNLIRNVSLPSLHQSELSLVRSGLCVLLRHIIKTAHNDAPHLQLINLLSFRQGSMKMCAEVSGWTKLCEVELASSISDLMAALGKLDNSSTNTLTLPNDLVRLEAHFQKKCRVHNDDKKRRAELVRLKKHLSDLENACLQQSDGSRAEDANHENLIFASTVTPGNIDVLSNPSKDSDSKIMESNQVLDMTTNTTPHSPEVHLDKVSFEDSHLVIEQTVKLPHGIRKVKVDKILDKCTAKTTQITKDFERLVTFNSEASTGGAPGSEKAGPLSTSSFSDIREAVEKLSYLDIEYVHTYSEGIEMTLADLILLVYIYHLLKSLKFSSLSLKSHIPRILQWACHMTSLATVVQAGQQSGWDMARFSASLEMFGENSTEVSAAVPLQEHGVVSFVKGASAEEDEDDMELNRCDKTKHRAIKPEVAQAMKKFEAANVKPVVGSHPCGENVQVDWQKLPPGVHPKEGDVPEKRTRRKCQQLENLVTAVQAVAKPGDILVDFCSGGGHLGIVMAFLLPECQVYLVENKEESLLKACSRLQSLNLSNVTLYQCNLDYFIGRFDVGVCLHACGSATDMVLQLCLSSHASFVICPCCYGSIRKTHLLSYPRSKQFLQTNVSYKDFLTLGHAADQTEFNIALEEQGRECMNFVDTDRAQYARELGYMVTLCSLQPLSCTPKNNLLVGSPVTLGVKVQ